MPKPTAAKPQAPLNEERKGDEREGRRVLKIVFLVSIPAVFAVLVATSEFQHYGYGVFVGVPLAVGLACSVLYNWQRDWEPKATLVVMTMTLLATGIWLVLLRVEGVVCVFMAAMLAWVIGLIGMGISWAYRKLTDRGQSLLLLLCTMTPFTMAFEHAVKPVPPLLEQNTIMEVDAPPEVVWRYVPAFPKIETPPTGLLSLDIAYPVASEMSGAGVGASRSCVLSTGMMPEIVTAWEPGRRLEFDVLSTPPAMTETNPFGHSETEHVEGYFEVKRGRFLLTALPGGRTRIEGTSWFEHDLWPQAYWAPLTRRVVKEIHLRVFEHIKQLAEEDARQGIRNVSSSP